jgi:mono/diheme cytochrome c family protein
MSTPRGSRARARKRRGSDEDTPESTGTPVKSLAYLAVILAAVVGLVVWLLTSGGVSPQERARREVEKPIGPLPSGDPPPIAAAGRVIYERNCMSCHGSRLSGGTAPSLRARRYEPSRWTNQDLANVVYGGSASMPAFKDTLSAGEIAAVVSYIRWEQGLPLPEVQPTRTNSTTAP